MKIDVDAFTKLYTLLSVAKLATQELIGVHLGKRRVDEMRDNLRRCPDWLAFVALARDGQVPEDFFRNICPPADLSFVLEWAISPCFSTPLNGSPKPIEFCSWEGGVISGSPCLPQNSPVPIQYNAALEIYANN